MDHGEKAREYFLEGYNCAQAVLCAYAQDLELDTEAAARLASSFGGGIGRLREVCGAVSSALMVLGAQRGYSAPGDREAKKEHYALVREYARRFQEKNGSIVCRDLLRDVEVTPGGEPEERTLEYYARRPCLRLVGEAAEILDEMLREEEI